MATVNAINSKSKGGGGLRGSLRYISQDKKVMLEDKLRLVSGVNCSPGTAFTEFMTTKKLHSKTDGRQFYHFVQSFHPDENVTPEQVHQIGLEFAERRFPGFEVVVATHMDTEHLHSHLIVNSVSYETGKKLHQSAEDLRQHRAVSDEICLAHGLTVLPPEPARSEVKHMKPREYRAAVKGDSWKLRLINAIDYCMEHSRTRRNFIENMRRLHYGVSWSDTRKHITYTCPNGYKCRDNRLHEAKYLKERMHREFKLRGIERAEPAGAGQAWRAVPSQNLRDPGEKLAGVPVFDAREPAPAAGDSGGTEAMRGGGTRPDAGCEIDPPGVIGAGETGWERERQALKAFERDGVIHHEGAAGNPEIAPTLALDGLSLAGNIAGLAGNIGEISEEPAQPVRPKTVHEHKRAVGQKQDDREQEYTQTM